MNDIENIIYFALGVDASNNYARIHFRTFTLKSCDSFKSCDTLKSCDSPPRITLIEISHDFPALRNYSYYHPKITGFSSYYPVII